MLSLGPGSACDVCLEPFGAELKAPCSIPCGHVFCVSCLQHIARSTCPLCRTPFEAQHTVQLHIDLDIDLDNSRVRAPYNPNPFSASTYERARQLQKRITSFGLDGGTEAQATRVTEEVKNFLANVPKTAYSDLRAAYKMFCYMCHLKSLNVEQGRTVNQLTHNATSLSQEVERLKIAIEALKIEKRRLEQSWQSVSAERDDASSECQKLHEQLDDAEAQILLVTE
ncbi:hypothetical protein DFH09DRAFT_1394413 [Mycena vulgaris]|nr:hypothetical protein DFH09DRAFT_1394413 [Mycena vulgaris]